MLIGGVTFKRAHIYSIEDPGTSQCFDSIGFHVIGSGTNLALSSLIASGCHADMSEADVLMRAVDAKRTAENAPGVGRITDVSVILPNRVVHFDYDQVKNLKECSRKWRNGDTACLDEVKAMIGGVVPAKETGVPSAPEPSILPAEGDNGSESNKDDATEDLHGGDTFSNEASPEDKSGEG